MAKKGIGTLEAVGVGILSLATLGVVFGGNTAEEETPPDIAAQPVIEEQAENNTQTTEPLTIRVPKSSALLENLAYEEVVLLFEDAGFTNVEAVGEDVAYSADVKDGSIIAVSVNKKSAFNADAEFEPDVPVLIRYRVVAPEPEPAPEPVPEPTSESKPASGQESEAASAPDSVSGQNSESASQSAPAPKQESEAASAPTPEAPAQNSNSASDTASNSASSSASSSAPSQSSGGNQWSGAAIETPSGSTVMCWIPTNGGTKYHTSPNCSNMKGPIEITVNEAQTMGFTACKRCH